MQADYMDDFLSKALFVFLGWLLGLLAPAIVDFNRKIRDAKETTSALKIELNELQYKLATSAYYLDIRYGTLEKDFILTLQDILNGYLGLHTSKNIKKAIDALAELPEDQIRAYADSQQAPDDGASLLKKHSAPFLDSKISSLGWTKEIFRNQILEVKNNLQILNEIVDDSRYFFNLTFQKISDENHKKASASNRDCYKNYSARAKFIVALIAKIKF